MLKFWGVDKSVENVNNSLYSKIMQKFMSTGYAKKIMKLMPKSCKMCVIINEEYDGYDKRNKENALWSMNIQ